MRMTMYLRSVDGQWNDGFDVMQGCTTSYSDQSGNTVTSREMHNDSQSGLIIGTKRDFEIIEDPNGDYLCTSMLMDKYNTLVVTFIKISSIHSEYPEDTCIEFKTYPKDAIKFSYRYSIK